MAPWLHSSRPRMNVNARRSNRCPGEPFFQSFLLCPFPVHSECVRVLFRVCVCACMCARGPQVASRLRSMAQHCGPRSHADAPDHWGGCAPQTPSAVFIHWPWFLAAVLPFVAPTPKCQPERPKSLSKGGNFLQSFPLCPFRKLKSLGANPRCPKRVLGRAGVATTRPPVAASLHIPLRSMAR